MGSIKEEAMIYEKKKAWGLLFRLYHWALALSIAVLIPTGLYIAAPWTNSTLEGTGTFPMADMRYIHFVAAFVFTGAVATRIYLWFAGNRQERIQDFAPVTPRNLKNLYKTMLYYLYISKKAEPRLGHNALAGFAYILTLLVALLQIGTGFFLLYPESSTWQAWGTSLFGSQQEARFLHHLALWYFALFIAAHIYILSWKEVHDPEGMISSIFNGWKFKPKDSSV